MNELNRKTDISVIVPLYHGSGYIPHVLETVRRNRAAVKKEIGIELILVNDSPEDPPGYEVFNEPFPVILISNPRNLGIQQSRINGLRKSTGEYVIFLDQDDELKDDALINLYGCIGDASAVSSDWLDEVIIRGRIKAKPRNGRVGKRTLDMLLKCGNYIGPPGHVLLRKKCIPDFWYTNVLSENGADDYLLWVLMLSEGCRFRHCPKKLYTHKISERNCSADIELMFSSEREAFLKAAAIYSRSDTQMRRYEEHAVFRREKLKRKDDPLGRRLLLYCKHPEEFCLRAEYKVVNLFM